MTQNQDYVEAGKVSEITNGHMKHVEINGKEIAIANLDENSMLLQIDVAI
jgi:hypothetical protein